MSFQEDAMTDEQYELRVAEFQRLFIESMNKWDWPRLKEEAGRLGPQGKLISLPVPAPQDEDDRLRNLIFVDVATATGLEWGVWVAHDGGSTCITLTTDPAIYGDFILAGFRIANIYLADGTFIGCRGHGGTLVQFLMALDEEFHTVVGARRIDFPAEDGSTAYTNVYF
jgi:hypothetical protein